MILTEDPVVEHLRSEGKRPEVEVEAVGGSEGRTQGKIIHRRCRITRSLDPRKILPNNASQINWELLIRGHEDQVG